LNLFRAFLVITTITTTDRWSPPLTPITMAASIKSMEEQWNPPVSTNIIYTGLSLFLRVWHKDAALVWRMRSIWPLALMLLPASNTLAIINVVISIRAVSVMSQNTHASSNSTTTLPGLKPLLYNQHFPPYPLRKQQLALKAAALAREYVGWIDHSFGAVIVVPDVILADKVIL
jgi:hypothetical protein